MILNSNAHMQHAAYIRVLKGFRELVCKCFGRVAPLHDDPADSFPTGTTAPMIFYP